MQSKMKMTKSLNLQQIHHTKTLLVLRMIERLLVLRMIVRLPVLATNNHMPIL